ncbi:TetR/AcrR family transcriptional regulator [Rhodanobacter sp. MP7CTX1]|uniref:TetR/AcrR family transcriptional regulator n=1 Tax=Rhodanobacter sp. MP7CTX1 TaxID=2723084 RepID=UPI0016139DFD|nr:TetR/AcrR family transcriptional regulator [Rhodanobacter sp. MP7CTX1]MBB6186777.1 AcrR family transcriptional regulator [Rhodanobacter sp. MP7CTX1]
MASRNSDKPAAREPNAAKKRGSAPRRPGRPTGGAGGIDQRSRLLDIALTLFARQGIADTTLAAIAREAGVTPAMVHYYFKTRDQLLDLLIEERFLPVRVSVESVFKAHADDPVAAITQLVQRFMDIAAEHPWFAPLWIREVISENGLLKQQIRKRLGDANQHSMLESIARWQTEGRLNADLEPSLVFLSLLGLTILPLTAARTWRKDPVLGQLGAKEITRHALALLGYGIGPQRPTSKKH